MKKVFCLITYCLLFLLSGCTSYRHTTKKEIEKIEQTAYSTSDYLIKWGHDQKIKEEELSPEGLTEKEAISMALIINPNLKAQFETLGIAKADLIQAGFLTNPRLDTLFQFPRKVDGKTCIDVDIGITISDFWQIPLRKKVANKELEIASQKILSTILTVIEATKHSYNRCLYEEAQLATIQSIVNKIAELHEAIYLRQMAGLASDYDVYFADTTIGIWHTKLTEQQTALKNAYLNLRNTVGIKVINKPIRVRGTLQKQTLTTLPDGLKLVEFAKETQPEVTIMRMRIKKAEHKKSLEKYKIVNDVTFGISYTRGSDGNHFIGPAVGMDLPVFDWNHAQIERAQKEKLKAEQDLIGVVFILEENVLSLANAFNMHKQNIELYEKTIIPAATKATEYAHKYAATMQLDSITFINSQIELYQQKLMLNQEYLELLQGLATLEKTIGGNIPL